MDRIDLVVQVRALTPEMLTGKGSGDSTQNLREMVLSVRRIQADRSGARHPRLNSLLGTDSIRELCPLGEEHIKTMRNAVRTLGMTARGFHRILRVARTIADMEGKDYPTPEHLAEAIQYRPVLEGPVPGL